MRFPPYADLDADQISLYSTAPTDGALLVTGPPGTGKTVIAMHRALKLASDGSTVNVIMFNKVLRRYTSNFESANQNLGINHAHRWFPKWYREAFKASIPKLARFAFDWKEMGQRVLQLQSEALLNALHWGHLIIDEGQDFPPAMYSFLMKVVGHSFFLGKKGPTLTVFADENQTITETNSSISQISEALNTCYENRRLWRLDKNYRNSLETARFARYYQVTGASSAILPDKEFGLLPTISVYEQAGRDINQIVSFSLNSGAQEVGVIVFGTKGDVGHTHREIRKRLEDSDPTGNIRLQGYSSGKEPLGNVDEMVFDKPPSITVVHSQSAKGLEFDAVFVVNFQALDGFDGGAIESYKRMYVISSRARSVLVVFLKGAPKGSPSSGFPTAIRILPNPTENICDYYCIETWGDQLDDLLAEVDWLPSATQLQREKFMHSELYRQLLKKDCDVLEKVFNKAAQFSCNESGIQTTFKRTLADDREAGIVSFVVELGARNVKHAMEALRDEN